MTGVLMLVSWLVAGTAAQPALDLQHVANAGMLLRCGTEAVLVDALFREGVAGYGTLPAARREALEAASPPFQDVTLVLATHRHADHFDAEAVARHLAHNPRAHFWGTPQTAGAVRERARIP